MTAPKHPAKFSAPLLPVIESYLCGYDRILDPLAGVGTLARYLNDGRVHSNELEPEWAEQCPKPWSTWDASAMPVDAESFDAIATSPAYANRMADAYAGDAKGTRRYTYRIALDRPLHHRNSGGMAWGENYRFLHRHEIWPECVRVLRKRGRFVLNVSDHIRDKSRRPVSAFHIRSLIECGLTLIDIVPVPTQRIRHGDNSEARVPYEFVAVFDKP